ncbi:MAG: hypothetical protein Q9178_003535 [Gyalolechia marmorata]
MMNPRAYALSSAPHYQQRQPKSRDGTSNAAEPFGTRPMETKPSLKRDSTTKPPTITSISPAAPSKPVIIPTRTKADRRNSRAHVKGGRLAEDRSIPHDSQALSPSVAAFFAIKSLRDSKGRTGARISPRSRPDCIEDGRVEAIDIDTNKTASSAFSPRSWRVLLSPPQEMEDEGSNPESEITMDEPLASLRSLSSESMPSLETDTESAYASSSPSTPGFATRRSVSLEKRSKSISSSVPEDCHSDHPLLIKHPEHENVSEIRPGDFETNETTILPPNGLSLRSNLTASFRRLKYAARNITTIGAPVTSRDDVQAQATLSGTSRFADERRPLPSVEPPDPALRRYLNPITISPAELYRHRDREEGRASRSGCTASIQMQSYRPGARKSEKATAPPVFIVASPHRTPVDELAVSATSQRHREPRENSDFLRVIVLEMNMRKVGKLSDISPGRARLWLPARRSPMLHEDTSSETPRRWISSSP